MFQTWEYDLLYPSLSNAYKSSKNIPKIAVERQAREYTTLQAQTRIKAMKQKGLISGRVKLSEYRYKEGRNAQFAQILSEEYNNLRTEQKLTPKQARELIGIEFFGSDDDEI